MKIAYFHGLESKPTGAKIDYLIAKYESVYAPEMDYFNDADLFEKTLQTLLAAPPDLLAGSSMGGRFAYFLSSFLDIPTVLFNPALGSHSVGPEVRMGDKKPKQLIVLGKTDDVIIPEYTLQVLDEHQANFEHHFVDNGHRTPFEVFVRFL
jgi:hypothetical protein